MLLSGSIRRTDDGGLVRRHWQNVEDEDEGSEEDDCVLTSGKRVLNVLSAQLNIGEYLCLIQRYILLLYSLSLSPSL